MRNWIFLTAFLLTAVAAHGADRLPAANHSAIGEMLRVQKLVQADVAKVHSAVVAIESDDGTASGVIINEQGLILTAAHVAEKPGRTLRIVLEDGSAVKGLTLGLDKTTDAALMKMVDAKRKWPSVTVCREVEKAQPGEWCFALGHPGGFDKSRGVVLRVGKIIKQSANALQTDCVLMGGDSGGPLFNLDGQVIGIHSQIWEGRDENMHVSMAPFLRSMDAMKTSKVIHVWSTGSGGYLGVATEESSGGRLGVVEVIKGSPAEKAGLRAGDVIVALNGEVISEQPQFSNAVRQRAPGDMVKLRIRSGDSERELPITLGTKPLDEG